jgi:DNA-binding response OmpR family regulator
LGDPRERSKETALWREIGSVVEDDSNISESIGLNLELSDYDYLVFDDGLAVVERLKDDHSFDLALLDIMLSGLDGFALMETMQQYNIPFCIFPQRTTSSPASRDFESARKTIS